MEEGQETVEYALSNGRSFIIPETICIDVPETIFTRKRGPSGETLVEFIRNIVGQIDSDFKLEYASNIILTGRTTLF